MSDTATSLCQARADAVMSATDEIRQMTKMLQKHIIDEDTQGTIYPVTRVLFARFQELADAIDGAVDEAAATLDEVRSMVYGKEAAHV